ncbi:hypothetical protein B0H65DRAFT_439380 [Neurospora tetraspora]|uniref:Uncharacterized protein n=1 Tax=Neurospora tetraspora TaxID=94610 RepID=A0AAE0JR41_9PEZI|nr:hypothetical protein B0H65DRAFT_439380 [Neurospora tetraspora]
MLSLSVVVRGRKALQGTRTLMWTWTGNGRGRGSSRQEGITQQMPRLEAACARLMDWEERLMFRWAERLRFGLGFIEELGRIWVNVVTAATSVVAAALAVAVAALAVAAVAITVEKSQSTRRRRRSRQNKVSPKMVKL